MKNISTLTMTAIFAATMATGPDLAEAKTRTMRYADFATRLLQMPPPARLLMELNSRVYQNVGCNLGRYMSTTKYGQAGDPGRCPIMGN